MAEISIKNTKEIKKFFLAIIVGISAFFYIINDGELPFNVPGSEGVTSAQDVQVVSVVDGDTFDISTGERVRLIGIDTPERGELFYKEAKDALIVMTKDKTVRLEKDVSEKDRYGRLLRHVYIDDEWINKKMIEEGYARLLTISPDVAHVDIFRKAEKSARNHKKGLWATSQ